MIEAKDKEQAVLHLYRMYDLQPVKHGTSSVHHCQCLPGLTARAESLRPPATKQTTETKGRKSNKAAKGAQPPSKKKRKLKAAASDEESSEWPGNEDSESEGGSASDLDAQLDNMEHEPAFVDAEQPAQTGPAMPVPRVRRTRGEGRVAKA